MGLLGDFVTKPKKWKVEKWDETMEAAAYEKQAFPPPPADKRAPKMSGRTEADELRWEIARQLREMADELDPDGAM